MNSYFIIQTVQKRSGPIRVFSAFGRGRDLSDIHRRAGARPIVTTGTPEWGDPSGCIHIYKGKGEALDLLL